MISESLSPTRYLWVTSTSTTVRQQIVTHYLPVTISGALSDLRGTPSLLWIFLVLRGLADLRGSLAEMRGVMSGP